jgi:integrase
VTTWPDSSFALLHRYVRQRGYRGPQAGRQTASVLRCFQRFVMGRAPAGCSRAVLAEWLHSLVTVARMSMVIRRAQIVDPFLDWLVERGDLTTNPLAEIKAASRPHGIRPIVLALLSDDAETALARLRPPPRYGSHLGAALETHVLRMRTLGYKCNESPYLRFDRFLQRRPDAAADPVPQLIQAYVDEATSPSVQYERLRVGRALARALQRNDPSAPAPPPYDSLLKRAVRRQHRRPYVFSHDEVARLLRTARGFPSPQMPLRPHSLYAMLVVAYCAGLRIGEIVRLQLADLRLEEGLLEIRQSKFFKSRRVPLRSSVLDVLKRYLEERARAGLPQEPDAPLFCHDRGGYVYMTAERLLREVIRAAGLKPAPGRRGPRVHDLRHTFVVHRMLEWYRQDINPESKLPYLSTFLGHRGIHSTLVCLTITQELLGLANERFRVLGAPALVPAQGESHAFDPAPAAQSAAHVLPRLVDPPARRVIAHDPLVPGHVAAVPALRRRAARAGRRAARAR